MSFWYTTSRALLFSKAHPRAVVRMILVCLSVLVLVVGIAEWGISVYRDIERQKAEYTFVVVLKQGVPDSLQLEMVRTLSAINAVHDVKKIDSIENWNRFANDISLSSDNILMLASIPSTVEVEFKKASLTTSSVLATKTALYTTYPNAISNIIYQPEVLQMLETQQYTLRWLIVVAGVGIVLLGILVFQQAFMVEVYASANHFYVAKTLGSGRWFVAMPHLVIGLFCWAVAAVITIVIWCQFVPMLYWFAPWLRYTSIQEIAIVFGAVSTLCGVVYSVAVLRFAKNIELQNT